MNELLENKRAVVIIVIIATIAFIALLVRLFYVPSSETSNNQSYFTEAGPNVDVVPTIAPDGYGNGGGLDINSPIVKESQQNIEKVKDKLPYSDNFKSSSGIDVSVFIPDSSRQVVPWELEVVIGGVKYLRDPNDQEYNNQKTAFLETVDRVYNWVKQNGADPSKIYFGWSSEKESRDVITIWINSR